MSSMDELNTLLSGIGSAMSNARGESTDSDRIMSIRPGTGKTAAVISIAVYGRPGVRRENWAVRVEKVSDE
jgi:hypothetical protein